MSLQDPVVVYVAETNAEAELVRHALEQSGIEAYAMEDSSIATTDGSLPGIHTPKVWVDRSDVERVVPLLEAYEEQKSQVGAFSRGKEPEEGASIEATCEECGQSSTFPANQHGSVQQCPNCGAYIDVGETDQAGDWGEPEPEPTAE